MKDEIVTRTGADEYAIQVNEPYDDSYDNMAGVAQEDQ